MSSQFPERPEFRLRLVLGKCRFVTVPLGVGIELLVAELAAVLSSDASVPVVQVPCTDVPPEAGNQGRGMAFCIRGIQMSTARRP